MVGIMSRYCPALVLIAATLLIGCGGGTSVGPQPQPQPQPERRSVDLSWKVSVSSVIGYNIYRGTTPGGPYPSKLNSSPQPGTSFVDDTVTPGTYYYVATSLDPDFVESSYSDEVTAVVP